ncbi:unnamed protein product [Arctogadus glacialis]
MGHGSTKGTTAVDYGSKGLRCSEQKDANRVALRGKLGRRTGGHYGETVAQFHSEVGVVNSGPSEPDRDLQGGVLLSSDCPKGLTIYYPAVPWAI